MTETAQLLNIVGNREELPKVTTDEAIGLKAGMTVKLPTYRLGGMKAVNVSVRKARLTPVSSKQIKKIFSAIDSVIVNLNGNEKSTYPSLKMREDADKYFHEILNTASDLEKKVFDFIEVNHSIKEPQKTIELKRKGLANFSIKKEVKEKLLEPLQGRVESFYQLKAILESKDVIYSIEKDKLNEISELIEASFPERRR